MTQNATAFGARLLEGISVPALLCQPDAGVVAANGAAGALLVSWARRLVGRPAGDLLGCLNAQEFGCGKGPRCAQCPVRAAIRRAAAGERIVRQPVAMELLREGRPHRVELRVSAVPAVEGGQVMVLLTLAPAEWVP